jgi:NAD(P)H-hydrate epimerase
MITTTLPGSLYTARQVRELDRIAIEVRGIPGLTLMRRAASACVQAIARKWPESRSVVVFCGSGNNAGDGYIVAGMLAEKNMDVRVHIVGQIANLSDDAKLAYEFCVSSEARISMFTGVSEASGQIFDEVDVIVDALLGIGAKGVVRENYSQVIDAINQSRINVLAIDIPSGLDADTGAVLGVAIKAQLTVTFIGVKQGLLTNDGPDLVGELFFSDLDVPPDIYSEVAGVTQRLDYSELIKLLPRRARNAHKNRFGHVLVVGGDSGMGGAVAMAGEAAMRSGAGLVTVATHPIHASQIMAHRPELMVRGIEDYPELAPLLAKATVVVLGPGLGDSDWARLVWDRVLKTSIDMGLLMVVDAGGLNLLAGDPVNNERWVLTPHPGEAANLLHVTGASAIQADRFSAVRGIQEQYGGAVLLKGCGTLIQSTFTSLSTYGNPGMSSAGMGDILSGVIGGLLAQGLEPQAAAQLGAVVHSLAADQCTTLEGEKGLLATDLLPRIRSLLNEF